MIFPPSQERVKHIFTTADEVVKKLEEVMMLQRFDRSWSATKTHPYPPLPKKSQAMRPKLHVLRKWGPPNSVNSTK